MAAAMVVSRFASKDGGAALISEALRHRLLVDRVAERNCRPDGFVDEAQWKQELIDLPRVMKVVKSVYLVLEHSNEVLLRVAVEIVTCRLARKCLWWSDFWFSEEDKRESFKAIVKEKFARVVTFLRGSPPEAEEVVKSDDEELMACRARLREAEAAANAANKQQQLLEARMREVELHSSEGWSKVAALEKSLEHLRLQARARPDGNDDMANKLAELERLLLEAEQRLKIGEEQRAKLAEKLSETERQLKAAEKAAKDAAVRPPEKAPQKEAAAAPVVAAPQVEKKPPKKLEHETKPEKPKSDNEALERERERRRLRELEEEMERQRAEAARLLQELQLAQQRAEAAEQRASKAEERFSSRESVKEPTKAAPVVKQEIVVVEDTALVEKKKELEREIADLKSKLLELDKLKAKLARREAEIAELKEANAKLQDEREKMLRTLHLVREQLRKVTEIAEKRGFGNLIAEILAEAGLSDTVNSTEFSCFARLYEDALRRQERFRNLERARFGQGLGLNPEQNPPHRMSMIMMEPQLNGVDRSASPAIGMGRPRMTRQWSQPILEDEQEMRWRRSSVLGHRGSLFGTGGILQTSSPPRASVFAVPAMGSPPSIVGVSFSPVAEARASSAERSNSGSPTHSGSPSRPISRSVVAREAPRPELVRRSMTVSGTPFFERQEDTAESPHADTADGSSATTATSAPSVPNGPSASAPNSPSSSSGPVLPMVSFSFQPPESPSRGTRLPSHSSPGGVAGARLRGSVSETSLVTLPLLTVESASRPSLLTGPAASFAASPNGASSGIGPASSISVVGVGGGSGPAVVGGGSVPSGGLGGFAVAQREALSGVAGLAIGGAGLFGQLPLPGGLAAPAAGTAGARLRGSMLVGGVANRRPSPGEDAAPPRMVWRPPKSVPFGGMARDLSQGTLPPGFMLASKAIGSGSPPSAASPTPQGEALQSPVSSPVAATAE